MRLPHTLVLTPISEVLSDDIVANRVDNVQWTGSSVSVKCQITPETPTSIFENYGLNLEKPHLMIFKVSDFANVTQGALGTYDGRTFKVETGPKKWASGLLGSQCCEVILDEQPAYEVAGE